MSAAKTITSDEILCSSCSSQDLFTNEYGVCQCRKCGCILKGRLIGGREGSHRIANKQKGTMEKLEEAAEFYGYSFRRFYDKVREGKVLGISYDKGSFTFHCEPNEIKGPIDDVPQEIILPVGTKRISLEACDASEMSGRLYVIEVKADRRHPVAILQSEAGYPGAFVRVIFKG